MTRLKCIHWCTALVLSTLAWMPAWAADLDTLLANPKDHHSAIIAEVDKAEASYKQRLVVEPKLITVLNSGAYSNESKTFIAEQLYRLCDEDTVPAFEKLLYRSGTSAIAAKGLGVIKHNDAQRALLRHLPKVGGSTRNAIIEALGNRKDDTAIAPISKYVRSSSSTTSETTLIALGKIGGPEAAQILGISRLSVRKSLQGVATDAYIQCGWTAIEREDHPTALDIFDMLFIDIEPVEIRAQALRGIIRTEKANGMSYIVEALEGNIEELKTVAVEEAAIIPGTEATKELVKMYSDLSSPLQALIVEVLGIRADEAGLDTVIQATRSRDPQVRINGLKALANFSTYPVLQPLLKASAMGTEEEKAVALNSLSTLEGDIINQSLSKVLLVPDNAVRLEAVKLVPIRNATEAIPSLVRIVERGDLAVIQFEALKALCTVGTYQELPILVNAWIGDTWTDEQRAIIGEGVIAVAQRSPEGEARVDALHDALTNSTTPEAQLSVIDALNQIKEDESVHVLNSLFKKSDPEIQTAILDVWAGWPTAVVLPSLEKQARTQEDVGLRDTAFDGLSRILNEVADPASPDTLKYTQKAAKIANTSEKRRTLFPVIESLDELSAEKIWAQLLKADASLSEDIEALRTN